MLYCSKSVEPESKLKKIQNKKKPVSVWSSGYFGIIKLHHNMPRGGTVELKKQHRQKRN